MSSTPEVVGKLLESEFAKYEKIIRESGMKVE